MKQVISLTFRAMENKNCFPIIRSIKILLFLLFIFNHAIATTTITTTGSGNWNSTTPNQPWPSGIIPATGDNVIIGASFTLTVTDNRTCNAITIGSGSTLSISSSITLTVTASLTFPHKSAASITGTLTGSGSLSCVSFNVGDATTSSGSSTTWTSTLSSTLSSIHATGNLTIQSTVNGSRLNNGIFNLQSGTMTVDGSVVTTNGSGNTSTLSLASGAQTGTLVIGGGTPFSLSGTAPQNVITLNGTSATVNYSGGNQTVLSTTYTSYTNLTLSGSGSKGTSSVTVNGTLSMEGTATASTAPTYGSSAKLQYNTTSTSAAAGSEWISPFTASGGVLITNTGKVTLSSTRTLSSGIPLTINSGAELATSGSSYSVTVGGDFTNSGTFTANGTSISVTFTGNVTNSGTFTASGSTLTFSGNLTNSSSATFDGGSASITFSGNFTNSGTFTGSSASIAIAGTSATQNIDGFTTTGTVSMTKTAGTAEFKGNVSGGAVTISGNGGTLNLGTSHTHTFTGTWTMSNGTTLNGGSSTLKLQSGFSGSGTYTFTANSGTVEYYASSGQTVAAVVYNNLTLSGSGAKNLTSVSTINGNLTLSGSATATTAAAMTVGGNITLSGTAQLTTGNTLSVTGSFTIGDGTTFTVGDFTLTISNTTIVGGSTSGSLTFSSGASATKTFTGLVTISTGGTCTNTNSNVTFSGGITNNGTFNAGTTGIYTFNATQSLSGTFSIPSITVSSGTLTNSGSLTITTALAGTGGLTNTGTLNINFTGAPGITTLTATGSGNTVNYGFAGSQTVKPVTYTNLTLSGSGAKDLTSVATINGNLTLSGTATATTATAMTVGGTLSIGDGTTFTAAGFNLTVTGTTTVGSGTSGNLTISSATGTKAFGTLIISTGGTWTNNTANSAVTFTGGITNNGTFNSGTGTHTFNATQSLSGTLSIPSVTVSSGTLTNSGTLTITSTLAGSGGLTNTGTLNINFTGAPGITTLTATGSGNTVNYGFAGTQTVFSTNYYHLTLSNSGVKTLPSAALTVSGNLTLSGTASTTTAGNLTVSGNLSIGDGTTLTAAGYDLTVTGITTVGGSTSGNLTISSATGTKTFGTVIISTGGTWTNTSANSDVTFTGTGGITNNGTFNAGTGIHTFNTNSQTLSGTFSIPKITVTGITLTNNNTLTISTALSGTGTMTQASSASLTIGGTITLNTISAAANSGNTVYYTGSSQTVKDGNYYNLDVSGATSISLPNGTVSIKGTFVFGTAITSTNTGTINFNGSSQTVPVFDYYNLSLTSASGTLFPSGTVKISGAFTPASAPSASSGTINFKGTSQTVPAFNYYNLDLTGATSTSFSSGTIGINGTFTPGTINTASAGTMDFNGVAAQTIPAFTYNNLNTSVSGTKTLGGAIIVNGSLTIGTSTTLDVSSGNNYPITIKGTWFNNGTFQPWGGTITFNNTSVDQSIDGNVTSQAFNNIIIDKNTKSLTTGSRLASLLVSMSLTITSGIFNTGAVTIEIDGDWTNNSSSSAFASTGTVTFYKDHNGTQTVGGSAATTFNNVTVSMLSGLVSELTLANGVTVQGTLTLTNRNINTGTNTVKANTIVRNTAGHIIGNLKKDFSSSALSKTFEIGTSSYYLPVSLNFSSIATTGTVTVTTANGDHANVSTSDIDPAKSVNRNWTITPAGLAFSNYNATFNYNSNDFDGGTDYTHFMVGLYQSSIWTYPAVSGTPTATSLTATGITTGGSFQVGNGIPSATQSPQTIYWTDLVGTTVSSNVLTKTAADGWNNGGAASENALINNTDGWIRLVLSDNATLTTTKAFGLTSLNVDADYKTIDYAFYISAGKLYIYENGQLWGMVGTLLLNDELVIERISGVIHYRKNGNEIPNSAVNSSGTLVADAALYSQNSNLTGLECSFALANALKVDATIVNSEEESGTATLTISGGNPPNKFIWNDIEYPSGTDLLSYINSSPSLGDFTIDPSIDDQADNLLHNNISTGLKAGKYSVSMIDANNHLTELFVHVGEKIVWLNTTGVTISELAIPKRKIEDKTFLYGNGRLIHKQNVDGWNNGYATTLNSFDNTSYGYIEFSVPQINTTKVIGFKSIAQESFSGTPSLKYSFEFRSDGTLIIHDNTNITTGAYNAGDVFSIENNFNSGTSQHQVVFKQNGNVVRTSTDNSPQPETFNAAVLMYTTACEIGNFIMISPSKPVIAPTISDINSTNYNSGSINLTVNVPPLINTSAYSFEWRNESNSVISNSQNISQLENGKFTLAFNVILPSVDGQVTINKNYSIGRDLQWVDQENTSFTAPDYISKSGGVPNVWDAGAVSANYIVPQQDGWFEIPVTSLSGHQIAGISTNPNFTDYYVNYGILLSDEYLFAVKNNVIVGWLGFVQEGDQLKISKEGSEIIISKNTLTVYQTNFTENENFYGKVSFFEQNNFQSGTRVSFHSPLKFHPDVSDASCSPSNDGAIDLKITGGYPPFNCTWSNSNTTQQVNNLSPGDYTVSVTDQKDYSASSTISVGTHIDWNMNSSVSVESDNKSLSKTGSDDWCDANGYSSNILSDNDGWIQFKVKNQSRFMLGFTALQNSSDDRYSYMGLLFEEGNVYLMNVDFDGFAVKKHIGTSLRNDVFKLMLDQGILTIYKNADFFYTEENIPDHSYLIDADIYSAQGKVGLVRSSFTCPQQ